MCVQPAIEQKSISIDCGPPRFIWPTANISLPGRVLSSRQLSDRLSLSLTVNSRQLNKEALEAAKLARAGLMFSAPPKTCDIQKAAIGAIPLSGCLSHLLFLSSPSRQKPYLPTLEICLQDDSRPKIRE